MSHAVIIWLLKRCSLSSHCDAPDTDALSQLQGYDSKLMAVLSDTHRKLAAALFKGPISHDTCVQMTVDAVKYKLSSHCGTPATDMLLQLRNSNGSLISVLTDSHRKLGFYSPQDG